MPELVADAQCLIAEGPVWHPDEGCLYWTDIPAGRIYRFDPASETHACVYEGEPVGGITVQDDGSLLLLGARGSVKIWRDGQVTNTILEEIGDERHTRFNDVIAGPDGEVISGTMATRDADGRITRYGRLYRVDPNGQHTVLLDGMGSPNGMGFTPDLRQIYVTDSFPGVQAIVRFDYDRATGTISNGQVFHRAPLDGSMSRPDGMTVASDGCIWSAHWDGAAVVRLGPNGEERARFPVPVARVSSVAFGGPDLTDLYITTACGPAGEAREPGSGGIYRLRSVGKGRPEFRSRIGL